jgi:tetratricopeptide (TPR) repeat protein
MNKLLFLFVSFSLSYLWPVNAEEIDAKKEYARCMKLAKTKPQKGFDVAIFWVGVGGGDAAKHCLAVSLLELKQYKEAAKRLEALAQEIRASKEFKAVILGQAGQALMLAGKYSQAVGVLTAAIKLNPKDLLLLVDRAQVAALQKDFARALKDLNHVLDEVPRYVDALVFRASAKRQLDQSDSAEIDINLALSIDNNHLEALLEHGILRRLLEDRSGARKDWLKIIKLSPDSEAARLARANLQRMDNLQGKMKSK